MTRGSDILVIGAGIVGCAIASELARRGAAVALLDARAPGDGATQAIEYTKADGSKTTVTTRVGAKPTTANLKRFLVGPKDCEITGICETPDGRAIFVNIQHPGETISKANIADPSKYLSHWPGNAGYGPGGANARPRSATIVITRNDGGLIAADGDEVLNNY